ncbi:PREDICTED: uncharacterized protein LOC105152587 [Acromyrmex echinatior]|uniref:uncharacterized protein LOC105152587 n=1 Tax=Acromyrmex echinatior TaxID=103372 RepID=UPI000581018B|nr:PREDICTED: uncharacterized protein LOC105152587 [Acromyrmex echinatior]
MLRASSSEGRRIAHVATSEGIQWHFNPPSAPHFGGLWEAVVKSAKYHLRQTIDETRLTFEEMSTLLAQVEACLNSRPMHALSDDSDDLTALTPGHLLIGAPLLAIPEPFLSDTKENLLSRWQLIQRMRDHFWQRWSREYLHTLATRPKWTKDALPSRIGSLCIIPLKEEFSLRVNSANIHRKLVKNKLRKDESIQEYYLTMRELTSQGSLDVESTIQYIIDGIPDDSSKVMLYGARNYNELRSRLRVYEKIQERETIAMKNNPKKKVANKANKDDAKLVKEEKKKTRGTLLQL